MQKMIFCTPDELEKFIKKILAEIIPSEFQKNNQQTKLSDKKILKTSEAAEYLNMSTQLLRRHVKSGKIKIILPFVKGFRFHRDDLENFLKSDRNK